jgi:rfaE bifunctional protein kinase chain/domain
MKSERFRALAGQYRKINVAVVGDFCLDRYLEIDPARQEISIETGLPVHNVVRVRAQPGGAGTIVNNLVALGIGNIYPVGFAGEDGEGFELRRALEQEPTVHLTHFLGTDQRQTFTYCKPLLVAPNKPPVELNRFDLKNWTKMPSDLEALLIERLLCVAKMVDAIVVLDQVTVPETGVVTGKMIETIKRVGDTSPNLLILADSRRGLSEFRKVSLKMNSAELACIMGAKSDPDLSQIKQAAGALARERQRQVFVTCAERGMVGARAEGEVEHVPALPLRGEIDIVGAGDAVTANLAGALSAGASLREALEIANAAASVVIHKLGTTGSASVAEIEGILSREPENSRRGG